MARRVKPRATVDPARQAAYDALLAVEADGAYLNLVLSMLLSERGVTGRDAAFATELAHATARMQGLYDAIIETTARTGSMPLQPEVRVALRLGAHQILGMRVPSHAAVTTGVELARAAAGERPVRLVNAVLRKIAATSLIDWLLLVVPARDSDPVGYLSVTYSHPRWVVEAFMDALGDDLEQTEALLAADNVAPLVSLAVRPGLAEVDDLLAAGACARSLVAVRRDPGRWGPRRAGARPVRPCGRTGRGVTARSDRTGPGDGLRSGRALARPVCRTWRQGRSADRSCPGAGRHGGSR